MINWSKHDKLKVWKLKRRKRECYRKRKLFLTKGSTDYRRVWPIKVPGLYLLNTERERLSSLTLKIHQYYLEYFIGSSWAEVFHGAVESGFSGSSWLLSLRAFILSRSNAFHRKSFWPLWNISMPCNHRSLVSEYNGKKKKRNGMHEDRRDIESCRTLINQSCRDIPLIAREARAKLKDKWEELEREDSLYLVGRP